MPDILYKELSYKIVGILFSVHSQLENRYQEKYYQRAVREALIESKLNFEKEIPVDLQYNNKTIGKYYLDFLIENKIVLELKAVPSFMPKDFKQVLGYLKAKNLALGILVNFQTEGLTYKRIINSQHKPILNE